MHELAICQSLIGAVERAAAEHGARRIARIVVAIGPLSGVEAPLLSRAFTIARVGTPAEDAELDIEIMPVMVHCPACDCDSHVALNRLLCERCGGWQVTLKSGDELLLKRIELATADEELAATG